MLQPPASLCYEIHKFSQWAWLKIVYTIMHKPTAETYTHTYIYWARVHMKARQTPLVINELIQIHDYLATTSALFIQLKTPCKKHFITCLDRPGSKTPGCSSPWPPARGYIIDGDNPAKLLPF